jgi:hypothetical protein
MREAEAAAQRLELRIIEEKKRNEEVPTSTLSSDKIAPTKETRIRRERSVLSVRW